MELKSKIKISTLLLLFFGGIAFFIASYFLTPSAFHLDYVQIFPLIIGLFFGVFGLIAIASIFFLEYLEIKDDVFIVKNILGKLKKEIPIKQIESYSLIIKEGKYGTNEELVLFFKNDKYKIHSELISNFDQFKSRMTKGKKNNFEYSKKIERRGTQLAGAFIFISGLFLFVFSSNLFIDKNYSTLSLVEIEGTVNKAVDINEINSKRTHQYVRISLKEFPEFIFKIGNQVYKSSDINLIRNDVKLNDKIIVEVSKEDFDKKISKTEELSFIDKRVNYNLIDIYSLRENNIEFVNKDAYNHFLNKSEKENWIFELMFLAIILYGLYLIFIKK